MTHSSEFQSAHPPAGNRTIACVTYSQNMHILFIFIFKMESHSVTQAGVQWCDLSSLQPLPPGSSDSCALASRVAGITSVHHQAQLIFVFLVEMRFHLVGQAGLKLLSSSDPPASAYQCSGYRHEPLCLASTCVFTKFLVSLTR